MARMRASVVAFVVAALAGCRPSEQISPGTLRIDDPNPVVSVRSGKALVAWHQHWPPKS